MSRAALAEQLLPARLPSARHLGARACIFEIPAAGQEQYEAVMQALGQDPARLFHCAGPTEDGWMVVEVWESQEAVDTFLTERLLPVVRKMGFFASIQQSFPVHAMRPGRTDGTFAATW
jgi:hypothetical protein